MNPLVVYTLIKAIYSGYIPANHPYLLNQKYMKEFKDCMEDYINSNIQEQCLSQTEKNCLFDVLSIFRFNYTYDTLEEKVKAYDWCNQMIGKLNTTGDNNHMLTILGLYEEHGFGLPSKISIEEYEDIELFIDYMAELEFYLLDYLFGNKEKEIGEMMTFVMDDGIEYCIYYLINVLNKHLKEEHLHFFWKLLEYRKQLSFIKINENDNIYEIQFEDDEPIDCEFTKEEVKFVQDNIDINTIGYLQELLKSQQNQKVKKEV